MSEYLIYDSSVNANYNINRQKSSGGYRTSDPWDHLPPEEWVAKQVEYCITNNNVAGECLIPVLQQFDRPLVGCEVGVCLGVTSVAFLKNVQIEKYYAVDPYPAYLDWNGDIVGANFSEERQKLMKETAFNHLAPYKDKIQFEYKSSTEFAPEVEDESLDFIFIDGDHSYEGCMNDFNAWWPKIKKGGLFAGHDYGFAGVNQALREYFGPKFKDLHLGTKEVWYCYKD